MKKQFIKTTGSILIAGLFLFFAFASSEEENENSNGTNNDSSQNESAKEPTEEECWKCDGFGKYTPDAPPGFVNKTKDCEVCNGTGKLSE